ncbi:MAG: permease [candidate division Zixibacteria bacterium]|nr:permease [candidate division Zixibacteria bacterium]
MNREIVKLIIIAAVFLVAYFLPVGDINFDNRLLSGLYESYAMLHEYAREHVLLCLIPAFFIAGGISVFVKQTSVIKYFGAKANKWLSYSVASVSGSILAVCSCTVLPLFAGIYSRGAGIGPASAFLYSGPAINVLAIILTGRVLGLELGLARGIGAVLFGIIIGLLMGVIFRDEPIAENNDENDTAGETGRPLWKELVFFGSMIGILVFANWLKPTENSLSIWMMIFKIKWIIALGFAIALLLASINWFKKAELSDWHRSTLEYIGMIMPLLFIGVLAAGFLLGRPGHEAIIPSDWVAGLVGGNSLLANLFASIAGAFMYFATLTEIPILQGLIGAGMGKGPALALLLAGPALSLPNMIVIKQVMGAKRTLVFVILVITLSTSAGVIYGNL